MKSTTKNPGKLDLVAHVCNPGTQKVEEGDPGIQNQLEIQSKPEASLSYILFSLKKKNQLEALVVNSMTRGPAW